MVEMGSVREFAKFVRKCLANISTHTIYIYIYIYIYVLMWDLWVDDSMANLTETPSKEDGSDVHKKYVVPKGYMVGETEFTERIIAGLRVAKWNQYTLDTVYDKLMVGLKRGLKEVTCDKQKKDKCGSPRIWQT